MPALRNPKHEAIVQAYIADPERVGWRAYRAVHPDATQRSAENGWSRLVRRAEVRDRINELLTAVAEKTAEKTAITAAAVIDELAKIGFSNMADYMQIGADGRPYLDFSGLTRDKAAAIQELVVETRPDPIGAASDEGPPPEILKVRFKLADKRAALVDLGKHLGLFKERVEHDVADPLKELMSQIAGTAFRPKE